MFKDLISKIVAGLAAIFGALFLYQKHKANVANDEKEEAERETEDLKVEMRVDKSEQELKTQVIEGKSLKSSIDRKKIIDDELKKQKEKLKDDMGEYDDGEDFTFRT